MRLRTRVQRVRLGGGEYRVVRPADPPRGAYLLDHEVSLQLYADGGALRLLAAAMALAGRSPRSIVYLPLRRNDPPDGVAPLNDELLAPMDLVLLHHSLQFPASRWKAVRALLRAGTPRTDDLGRADLEPDSAIDYERRRFREYRDHLRFRYAANTLFLVGSRRAFREQGTAVQNLSDRSTGQERSIRGPQEHHCVTLSTGPWGRVLPSGPLPGLLHIEYRPDWTGPTD